MERIKLESVAMAPASTTPTTDTKTLQLTAYNRLLHELQFRACRNALMNYHEAGKFQEKSSTYLLFANGLTAATASGIFVGILQKGAQLLASKAGLAGIVGVPVCGIVQLLGNQTSEVVPSFKESAKKHIKAAAAWVSLAEQARFERMRIKVDPDRRVENVAETYNKLIQLRAEASAQVMVSQETHRYFSEHPEMVRDAVKRRVDAYAQYLDMERDLASSTSGAKCDDTIYF